MDALLPTTTCLIDGTFQRLRRACEEQVDLIIVQRRKPITRAQLYDMDRLIFSTGLKSILPKDACRHGSGKVNFEAFEFSL
jgi:hypothetical protein